MLLKYMAYCSLFLASGLGIVDITFCGLCACALGFVV